MGTRGFKVYRHRDKGRYYVYYNHRDSYPHGLRLQVLDGIPRDVSKEVFEKWVKDTREDVYAERDSPELNDPDDSSNFVSDKQPDNDFLIEWIYEIDLDNLVFHVDSQPLFRLDNMPPDNIFLKSISFDQFGHRALHEDTPTQYRYDWRAPPPSPNPESLAAYNSCHIRSSTSSVHDLLDVPVALSSIERIRMALVKLLVKRCMVESGVGHDVRVLENVPDRDHIPQSMLQLALSLVNFAIEPPIPSLPCIPYGNNCDFVWIRKDVCLRITIHLDDEDNLKYSIGDLSGRETRFNTTRHESENRAVTEQPLQFRNLAKVQFRSANRAISKLDLAIWQAPVLKPELLYGPLGEGGPTEGDRVIVPVYRHKGRYYVYYNHWDSYPHGLGLEVLHEIPRNVSKEEFEEWVRKTREYVYAQRDSQVLNNPDDPTSYVSDEHPYNDFSIEWIYEIDLDNLVFHVDNQPLFRLDNMPPDDIFMKSISFDHFGHRALHEHTPAQYRYDWRSPPPSPLPAESLAAYNSCYIRSSTSSVHDLLDVPMALSSIERVRTAFVQLLVTMWMAELNVGHEVRVLENVPDPRIFTLNFAVGPPIPSLPYIPCGNTCDFIWIRKDVCSRITTHLDDEDNLKTSIGDLVHHISITLDKVGTIYGIACSVFHCAIVRVDKDELGTTSFAHTPALQFLPSFYARTMFTSGIEALSRLGSQASRVELLDAISDANNLPRFTHEDVLVTDSVAAKVPVEVWTRIGDFITSPADLVTLPVSHHRQVVQFYPFRRPRRILRRRISDFIFWNWAEQFIAVRDGRRTKVELGQDFDDAKIFAGRRKIPFEAQTYLIADPAVIADDYAFNNLYILDLDDDNLDTS
ncbi:hypothetical protein BGY98DRAFT_1182102 [Russula aff. rugulosa BPL654]|nr:hypothetical protein BGY98DRAFT_1182102 [Russula aff. rugulosa BPL654]